MIVYDIEVTKESARYKLDRFYTRDSIVSLLSNINFINTRREEIIGTMNLFNSLTAPAPAVLQASLSKLDRLWSWLQVFNTKSMSFNNIDDVWAGFSLIFEAFFYSRSHCFRNEREIRLHLFYDKNAL